MKAYSRIRPRLRRAERPSRVYSLLESQARDALRIKAALEPKAIADKIVAFLDRYSLVRPALNGQDFQRMGIRPGRYTRSCSNGSAARLDGRVKSRNDELNVIRWLTGSRGQGSGSGIDDMLTHGFDLPRMLLLAPVILFSLSFHEFAHAWVALKLGDPTAAAEGRVSLNPLRHLDPIGTIAIFLFGFGWAKPVPINPYFLRGQARGFALTAMRARRPTSSPRSRSGIIYRLLDPAHVGGFLLVIADLGVYINLALAAFNLIPIPPLDGSRVVYYLLPRNLAANYIRLEPFGMWIVIGLLLLDSRTNIIGSWMWFIVRLFGGLFRRPDFRYNVKMQNREERNRGFQDSRIQGRGLDSSIPRFLDSLRIELSHGG